MRRILVIKLGALGDFVQATAAFADIRSHEKSAHITLLTTPAFKAWAEKMPWFDTIIYDTRKPFWHLGYLFNLRRNLHGFDMVYDLQTNQRTGWYYHLAGKPAWCGIAKGCSHPHTNPERNDLHTLERIREQLATADIKAVYTPNILPAATNADEILAVHGLQQNGFYALVPGGSAHRPEKRWPYFKQLAKELIAGGNKVALVGGPDEKELLENIAQTTGALNLGGQTNLNTLIDVMAKAAFVIGNDTGPMHIASASNTPGIVLFGPGSNPALCAPRAANMLIMHKNDLNAIQVADIIEHIKTKQHETQHVG